MQLLEVEDELSQLELAGQLEMATALDSEMLSEKALNEVILDDDMKMKRLFVQLGRRRRSSVSPNQDLLLKQHGPTLGLRVLQSALKEFTENAEKQVRIETPDIEDVLENEFEICSSVSSSEDSFDQEGLVESWFVTNPNQNRVAQVVLQKRRSELCSKFIANLSKPAPSVTSVFLAALAQQRLTLRGATKGNEQNGCGNDKISKKKEGKDQIIIEEFDEIPSIELLQDHINHIKYMMGKNRLAEDVTKSKKKNSFPSKSYKLPFPPLKKRRDAGAQREKYIHSLIVG